MKSCLVLCDLDVGYKVNNFTTHNLKIIENRWIKIKTSLESTLRLVNRFGIDRETLSSVNALLPIAYYLQKISRGSLDGTTPFETSNAKRIQRWLVGSLLNGVFGGSSDQTIRLARTVLQESLISDLEFPYASLVQGLAARGRLSDFRDDNIESVLSTTYGKRSCFLALSLLYDKQDWGSATYHIDHIIPRSLADRRTLMAMNLPESRIQKIQDSVNSFGNLQILLGRENLEKNDTPFAIWIQTRDSEFLERHLIPQKPYLWDAGALPEFVDAREALIRQKLRRRNVGAAAPDDIRHNVENGGSLEN